MRPLTDDEIERIAERTVAKLVGAAAKIALVVVLAFWIVPMVVFFSFTTMANATAGMPPVVSTLLTASVIAIPLVMLVVAWSRMRGS